MMDVKPCFLILQTENIRLSRTGSDRTGRIISGTLGNLVFLADLAFPREYSLVMWDKD